MISYTHLLRFGLIGTLTAVSIPALASQYFPDYFPFNKSWSYHKHPNQSQAAGQWATWSNNGTNMIITWNQNPETTHFNWADKVSVEEFEIREDCTDEQSYVFLNAYIKNEDPNIKYKLRSITTLLTVGGNTYDLSNVTKQGNCARMENGAYIGHIYAPLTFYDQSYTLEVWGQIADAQGVFNRDTYWKVEYDPEETIFNPCWVGQGASSRKAIVQKEAYWDSMEGWSFGSGNPQTGEVQFGRYQTYGENVGPVWTAGQIDSNGQLGPVDTCVPNVWPY